MKRVIIYARDIVSPSSMSDVLDQASYNKSFRYAITSQECLSTVSKGDIIHTSLGNKFYVLDTFPNIESAKFAISEYNRTCGILNVNFKPVVHITPFIEWCTNKASRLEQFNQTNNNTNMKELIPTEFTAPLSINNEFIVKTEKGYVAITEDDKLITYLPSNIVNITFTSIPKSIDLVKQDDIIKYNNQFFKVLETNESSLEVLSYTGIKETINFIKSYELDGIIVETIQNPILKLTPQLFHTLRLQNK